MTGRLLDGFTWIRSVREPEDGRVLVATGQTRSGPFLADYRTRSIEEIGQVGEGPGDFRTASALNALPGDSTLEEDREGVRWTVLVGTRFATTGVSTIPTAFRPPF